MEYIDPVFAIGAFDVRNDELDLEATIEAGGGSSGGSSGPGAPLTLVPRPPVPLQPFGIPAWIFILGGIVFLIASEQRP